MTVANNFIFILTLILTAPIPAKELDNTLPETQQRVLDLSYAKMQSTISKLERQVEVCLQQEKHNVLAPALFNTIDLNIEQWKIVLLYFSFNASRNCEGDALWGNAVIALHQFKLAEKKYIGKNTLKTPYQVGNFCCAIWERELELELKYTNISSSMRKKLEDIPELRQPFHVIKSITAVELWLR